MSREEQRPRAATVLESVEEIRAQIARTGPTAGMARPTEPHLVDGGGAEVTDDARLYRPTLRPSMALLTVLDDGEDSGQVIRIRGASFLIGRVEGDLVIPHDPGISGRHAAIVRSDDGRGRWMLVDLESTNGTFARASHGVLKHRQEFLIGGRRLRFDDPPARSATAPADEGPGRAVTQKWQILTPTGPGPGASLVELLPEGEGRRHPLGGDEIWIGRDPRGCHVVLDDPMVSPRHAKVARNDRGQWVVSNARSRNGLWMRITEVPLDRGGYFQCGEQRFVIKIL